MNIKGKIANFCLNFKSKAKICRCIIAYCELCEDTILGKKVDWLPII